MIRQIIFTFILLFSIGIAGGEDIRPIFSPHMKLRFKASSETRDFSGTVYSSNEKEIRVITCWHGTMGFSAPKKVIGYLLTDSTDTHMSAKVMLDVIKFDSDKDIMELRASNKLNLRIENLELASYSLLPGVECLSYGYPESDNLLINKSSVLDYDYTTQGKSRILSVRAPAISGMSGGGLEFNNKLYGVQSSGKDNKVSYCPSYQIVEFLK